MTTKNKKNQITDAEYGVDSRYKSNIEKQSEAIALMEARLMRMKNLSKDEIIRAKLVQLKLKMEAYIKQPIADKRNYFSEFLESYIDALYARRSRFAHDIDITPVQLSQVINKHREPQDEFIMRLMIHSEKVYSNICAFNKRTWYQVYFHEKICATMSSQDQWGPEVEKHVRFSEAKVRYGKK